MSETSFSDEHAKLESAFAVCPECAAPWTLHWAYVWEGGERRRKWNTCGLTREQLETKGLDGGGKIP